MFNDVSGASAFDVLDQIADVTYRQHVFGIFVDSINGIQNNAEGNGYFWQYWVNGGLGPIAADNLLLNDGDRVLWKYCAPENPSTTSLNMISDLFVGIAVFTVFSGLLVGIVFLFNRKFR